jgi:hypothetical protein
MTERLDSSASVSSLARSYSGKAKAASEAVKPQPKMKVFIGFFIEFH